jgi:CheY-like chemotaxis protein
MEDNSRKLILVVEDSDADYYSVKRALGKSSRPTPVVRCRDGDETLDYLFRRGAFQKRDESPRPALILLDLNLPGTDGREVLDIIKRDRSLKFIPVVVLTSSDAPRDVHHCYAAGANGYINKPIDFNDLTTALKRVRDYWFHTAVLPSNAPENRGNG